MITVSVKRAVANSSSGGDNTKNVTDPNEHDANNASSSTSGYQYYLQCFDLSPALGGYNPEEDDSGSVEDGGNDDEVEDDAIAERTKIFTLQDHPGRICFNNDGNQIFMGMDIDPNSEENEKRRPAFLVFLNLTDNQLHRCRTVDRIIDHQTEFVADLSLNNDRSLMIVATGTHQGNGRLNRWGLDSDETRIIERNSTSQASFMKWTEDDSWLIIGRKNGAVEVMPIPRLPQKNEDAPTSGKTTQQKLSSDDETSSVGNTTKHEENVEVEREPQVSTLERKWSFNVHNGKIFHITTSNGLLITSAELGNLEYESFFAHHILWDIRSLMNYGHEPKIIATLGNLHALEKDITRLIELSPVTTRHVREGGGPGTLLAATGHCNLFCHNVAGMSNDRPQGANTNKSVHFFVCYLKNGGFLVIPRQKAFLYRVKGTNKFFKNSLRVSSSEIKTFVFIIG
ncbi:hypothetical protein RFI_16888 [Reticulomyxa filosa]|uniref:Uncharacterized protein n=1 Tax=Reticulomyxa filosa TaxID=46433 RepID=X6N370_RETFI|nr:hypothetical protein RFI_16888 [Reticulomyxa filosa]|eukprot:ETO20328.1 hypothetical protein RFI_16888 [Reticulomyxa filosa]